MVILCHASSNAAVFDFQSWIKQLQVSGMNAPLVQTFVVVDGLSLTEVPYSCVFFKALVCTICVALLPLI